jgi:glutaredoxin 3
MTAPVTMYCTGTCPYCHMAERLLQAKGVTAIRKIRIDLEPARRPEMVERAKRCTVPQIYVGTTHVGGYDELAAMDDAGRLDALLESGG